MMIGCVVIRFLYEGPQEIGEPLNIQFNQYQQARLHGSNFLKSCWLVAPIFINNIRGNHRWRREALVLKICTAHLFLTRSDAPEQAAR